MKKTTRNLLLLDVLQKLRWEGKDDRRLSLQRLGNSLVQEWKDMKAKAVRKILKDMDGK